MQGHQEKLARALRMIVEGEGLPPETNFRMNIDMSVVDRYVMENPCDPIVQKFKFAAQRVSRCRKQMRSSVEQMKSSMMSAKAVENSLLLLAERRYG